MAAYSGSKIASPTVGTTADTVALTVKANQVTVVNTHATNILYAKVKTGTTSALAVAAATADPAVAAANENTLIRPNSRAVVVKSSRPVFACVSVIASAITTPISVEGSNWLD